MHISTDYTEWLELFRDEFFQINEFLIFLLLNFWLMVNGWFMRTFEHSAFIYVYWDIVDILLINYVELGLEMLVVDVYSWKNQIFILRIVRGSWIFNNDCLWETFYFLFSFSFFFGFIIGIIDICLRKTTWLICCL